MQAGLEQGEASDAMADPEDAAVEALLTTTLQEIADTHPAEQVELQWLTECYLLQPQLAYQETLVEAADSAAASANTRPVTPRMVPSEVGLLLPCDASLEDCQVQTECFSIVTPTSHEPRESFLIYTPPSSDTETEKEPSLFSSTSGARANNAAQTVTPLRIPGRFAAKGSAARCPEGCSSTPCADITGTSPWQLPG